MNLLRVLLHTPMRRVWIALFVVSLGLWGVFGLASGRAQATNAAYMDSFPVEGNPTNIVVESAGRIWFTLPEENAIGSLVVTSTVDYLFTKYESPTPDSQPYDLVYDGNGAIWFTQYAGNKLAKFTIATESFEEFPLPTAESQPTGLALDQTGVIWVTQRGGNSLARFTLSTELFAEFPLPVANAQPEHPTVQTQGCTGWTTGSPGCVWVTSPTLHRVYLFQPSREQFTTFIPTIELLPSGTVVHEQPWRGMTDGSGVLWVVTRQGNRLGRYVPGTFGYWRWFVAPTPGSMPTDLAFHRQGNRWFVFFANSATGSVGQIRLTTNALPLGIFQAGLTGNNATTPQPSGIAVDAQGQAWVADFTGERIVRWSSPYFLSTYLPNVSKN